MLDFSDPDVITIWAETTKKQQQQQQQRSNNNVT